MKALFLLAAVALVGYVAFKLVGLLKSLAPKVGAAASAVASAPSNAANALASKVTGRDETFGGALAEVFDPTTRAANAMLKSPPVPTVEIRDDFVGDLPLDDSPGFVSNDAGAATGRVFKPRSSQ